MERNGSSRRVRRPIPRRIRPSPYPVRSCCLKVQNEAAPMVKPKSVLALEKKDWEDATCSVCMEYPHNAVLLLCSSHDKGCRPYMCGTSYRHSNCLDQFKRAYTKTVSENPKPETIELAACPLCRGEVKGWTVVEPAREYLNKKERTCMQDECSYTGTYKELQKHVRLAHPCAKPREVDPTLQQKWTQLEHEREREDVISTIRATMPQSVVFGDYVIEVNSNNNNSNGESDSENDDQGMNGGRGISRSILYFFLREGARLMSIENNSDGGDNNGVVGQGEDSQGGGSDGVGQRRRRRRRRSRVRAVPGSSDL